MGYPSRTPIRSWPWAASELEPTETASAGIPDDPSGPGSPEPPASDSDFDSNRDSNGGGRRRARWALRAGSKQTGKLAHLVDQDSGDPHHGKSKFLWAL
jgi:hypothetical protein